MAKQALEGNRLNAFMMDPEVLVIATDGEFCDTASNTLEPSEALIRNVMTYGVLEPVIVRKDDEGRPVVVAGRQRTRAAIEANGRLVAEGKPPIKIPVLPHRGSEDQAKDAMLFENYLRRQIPVVAKADQVATFCGAGRDEGAAALVFGMTVSAVRQHLALAEAPAKIKKAVEAGRLPLSAAVKAAKMTGAEIDDLLEAAEESPKGKVTVDKVNAVKRKAAGKDEPPKKMELRRLLESGSLDDYPQAKDMLRYVLYGAWEGFLRGVVVNVGKKGEAEKGSEEAKGEEVAA